MTLIELLTELNNSSDFKDHKLFRKSCFSIVAEIVERREEFGLLQFELAEKLETTQTNVSCIEIERKLFHKGLKKCNVCNIVKPFSEFGSSNFSRDGYRYMCRDCAGAKGLFLRDYEVEKELGLRQCANCREFLDSSDFHRNGARSDGLQTQCKECIHIKGNYKSRRSPDWGKKTRIQQLKQEWKFYLNELKWWQKQEKEYDQLYIKYYNVKFRKRKSGHPYKTKVEKQATKLAYKQTPQYKKTKQHHRKIRKYRKKGAPGSHTNEAWIMLCQQHNNRCLKCNIHRDDTPEKYLTRDHITPISKGGTNEISNIQPLCAKCNAEKHNSTINYRKKQYVPYTQLSLFS